MGKRRLLIVEDDESSQKVWQIVFGTRGWDVTVARTVAEGLGSLDPAPDYLILGLRLPDGAGELILRRVREAGLPTRVAVTTGVDDPDRLGLVRGLRPEALFQKPFTVADLWRAAGYPLRGGAGSGGHLRAPALNSKVPDRPASPSGAGPRVANS